MTPGNIDTYQIMIKSYAIFAYDLIIVLGPEADSVNDTEALKDKDTKQ